MSSLLSALSRKFSDDVIKIKKFMDDDLFLEDSQPPRPRLVRHPQLQTGYIYGAHGAHAETPEEPAVRVPDIADGDGVRRYAAPRAILPDVRQPAHAGWGFTPIPALQTSFGGLPWFHTEERGLLYQVGDARDWPSRMGIGEGEQTVPGQQGGPVGDDDVRVNSYSIGDVDGVSSRDGSLFPGGGAFSTLTTPIPDSQTDGQRLAWDHWIREESYRSDGSE